MHGPRHPRPVKATTTRDDGKPRTLDETTEGRDAARQITALDALVTDNQEGVVAEANQRGSAHA